MSTDHLANMEYTKSWVRDWLREGKRGERFIREAHGEQLSNLRGVLSTRRWTKRVPTWCDLGEYIACVRYLGRTTRSLRGKS